MRRAIFWALSSRLASWLEGSKEYIGGIAQVLAGLGAVFGGLAGIAQGLLGADSADSLAAWASSIPSDPRAAAVLAGLAVAGKGLSVIGARHARDRGAR